MRTPLLLRYGSSALRFTLSALTLLSLSASAAHAGPPLICHAFDIGNAKSLPFVSHDWNLSGAENYELRNLSIDSLAILDASQSPLVHMETLRRATLYARKDPLAAKQLLLRLVSRVRNDDGSAQPGAFAYLDAAYIVEAYKQWLGEPGENPASNLNGIPWIETAAQLRNNDPQMEFAAALIMLREAGPAQVRHAQRAIAGSQNDPLLASNLKSRFLGAQSQIMADLIRHGDATQAARQ